MAGPMNSEQSNALAMARRLVWLYCILWLIEGTLRKWVVPSLSYQLLLVRDPVALGIYFYAWRARVFPVNGWLSFLWVLTAAIGLQAIVHVATGSVSWSVAVFGVRTFVLHMPLIWVVPAVFGRKEITLLGKWVLILSLPMALLMVAQFQAGSEHWLNAATIKGGAQIGGAAGRVRPAGLFSFITGPIHFYALTLVFSIAAFISKDLYPRWLGIAGLTGTLIAMSISASRGLVMGGAVVGAFGMFAAFRSGRALGAASAFAIIVALVFGVLGRYSTIQEGIAGFQERWTQGDEEFGTGHEVVARRFTSGFFTVFVWAERVPILGYGVGCTSNLAVVKENLMVPVEGEFDRIVYEVGPITGFLFLGWRAALGASIIVVGFGALRSGNYLCLLLGSACFLDVLTGNIKTPTSYGYIGICGGLCLAAARAFSEDEAPAIPERVKDIVQEQPRARGRGRFAVGGATPPP